MAKRGPKVGDRYTTSGTMKVPRDIEDLARRRTQGLLDSIGMGKPLEHLLREAYIRGLKDAATAMSDDKQL